MTNPHKLLALAERMRALHHEHADSCGNDDPDSHRWDCRACEELSRAADALDALCRENIALGKIVAELWAWTDPDTWSDQFVAEVNAALERVKGAK